MTATRASLHNDPPRPQDALGAGTIPEALDRAAAGPHEIVFVDRSLRESRLAYAELARRADAAGDHFHRRGVQHGERVCLLSSTGPDLLGSLFGAWRIGAVPVLLHVPRRRREKETYASEARRKCEAVQARALVVADDLMHAVAGIPDGETLLVPMRELRRPATGTPIPTEVSPEDLALLQFTSGSTGRSRAVALCHDHLLTNIAAVATTLGWDREADVCVSWLPLFHDMGLIGALLGAMACGIRLVLEPTEQFIARPGSWLDAMSRYKGTITAGPDFGYGLAARDLKNRPRSLDLSGWRVAINGAEPIDPHCLESFCSAAAPHGFASKAMCPMYGLAECTLAVSVTMPDDPVGIVDAAAAPAATYERGARHGAERPLVSCGEPIPGTEVAIMDGSGETLSDGEVGEICVRGPGVMAGYWHDPEATAAAIVDGWLHTGDEGMHTSGGLVVCGRTKDMITVAGRNVYAEDYEFWAEQAPGVRAGGSVAFAAADGRRMVVVAETRSPAEAEPVAQEVLEMLQANLPRSPEEVVIVGAGSLPKTSSGKRQRSRSRERYEAGAFDALAVAKR